MRIVSIWNRGKVLWKGETLQDADLRDADLWRANLRDADLWRANLRGANLRGADLRDANLRDANLRGADLRTADLRGADLRGADLRGADLQDANLWGADLRGANLRGGSLQGANLQGADLQGANLLAVGDMRFLRTLQFDIWAIGYTFDTLQIGCQRHFIEKWTKWDTPAGRKWVALMDSKALSWAERNLALVLAIIQANPAERPVTVTSPQS